MDYGSFIAIDLGESIKPAFTCTNNDQVYNLIKELINQKEAGLI
jgi:hypothetical protein